MHGFYVEGRACKRQVFVLRSQSQVRKKQRPEDHVRNHSSRPYQNHSCRLNFIIFKVRFAFLFALWRLPVSPEVLSLILLLLLLLLLFYSLISISMLFHINFLLLCIYVSELKIYLSLFFLIRLSSLLLMPRMPSPFFLLSRSAVHAVCSSFFLYLSLSIIFSPIIAYLLLYMSYSLPSSLFALICSLFCMLSLSLLLLLLCSALLSVSQPPSSFPLF